ncbi:oxidoreductase [Stereum hirsutum FP-91666 SS1]|uniref:oxidoreductase n=1 Tax=Stereum hirsutum (strain FP-91666) TaxID=721885 RepID=UPI000440DD52|nr:oxidoreductase [Stereum hirsutum FP-91666 SS1]EIM88327.1 oxidoreductase [Stereum hirsutum FP-91666 SS1]
MLFVALAVLVLSVAAITLLISSTSKNKWNPRGRHCYVTGGSAGLGLALAILLTKKGADVSIVARNEEQLEKALEKLEEARITPNQVLKSYSFSLDDPGAAERAMEAACVPHGGQCPDAVFLCAGKATPGFFVEQDAETMKRGMDSTYWVSAWSAMIASQRMAKTRTKGKIVFVSSVLGYMSMFGYSTYTPGKHAIRGLADTLRQEMLLYAVDVHIYFPATIHSPGYVEENRTKPPLLLELEAADEGLSPEKAAEGLYGGLQRGDFHITDSLVTHLFRTNTRGCTPYNSNMLKEFIFGLIGWIGLPLWRRGVDKAVIAHREKHQEEMESKGFFVSAVPRPGSSPKDD